MNKTSIIAQLNRQDTDRLTFNYTKVFIDKITSYLMSGISFVVEAEEDSAALNRIIAPSGRTL